MAGARSGGVPVFARVEKAARDCRALGRRVAVVASAACLSPCPALPAARRLAHRSEPVSLTLDGVYLVAAPLEDANLENPAAGKEWAWARKKKRLAAADLLAAANAPVPKLKGNLPTRGQSAKGG